MTQDAGLIGHTIESFSSEQRVLAPSAAFSAEARIKTLAEYEALYRESLEDPEAFWARETSQLVFRKPAAMLRSGNTPHVRWFVGAELNVTESCLDRHLTSSTRDKAAIVFEGEPGDTRTLTYSELHQAVLEAAAMLKELGVRRGDRVAIYMGMVPEAVVAMLACARLGAPHTVVFGGFSADSLADRINDCGAKVVLTQDGAWRRGSFVPLKSMVDEAVIQCPSVEHVVVHERIGSERCPVTLVPGRDHLFAELTARADTSAVAEAEAVDAEHPLFILYTSGSTGRPKGVLHTSAGYLAGVHVTSKYVFDLREDDVYFCTADVGWITGHSYVVYGPLSNGATCVIYEGAPSYPDFGRLWRIIDRHRVTILYTAPTAIRTFIRHGTGWLEKADLSSLRLLGTVGEPINPEAWMWYFEQVGRRRCPIVDTWWQTETGAIMLTTLPGVHGMKPGATGLPFFGVVPAVVDAEGNELDADQGGLLVLKQPWPSMLRTVWGDDARFVRQYFGVIPGAYFTGDGARRDVDGYIHVMGRIDDVLNVSGHRIGTAEIESALVAHPAVCEAAAVGRPDEIRGQALVVFVTLKPGYQADASMSVELTDHVAREIGRFARPDAIRFTDALPKTRSGKIMRRLLKDLAAGREVSGDLSTLEDRAALARLEDPE